MHIEFCHSLQWYHCLFVVSCSFPFSKIFMGPYKYALIAAHNFLLRVRRNPQASAIHEPSCVLRLMHCGYRNPLIQLYFNNWPVVLPLKFTKLYCGSYHQIWLPQFTSCGSRSLPAGYILACQSAAIGALLSLPNY